MSTVDTNQNITYYTGNTNTNASGTSQADGDTLTQSDFLNLLVAQMQYQDPTDPESDTDFATQMAQFGTLNSMDTLNTTMSQYSQFSQMAEGAGLIGGSVTSSATDSSGNLISGQVTAVTATSGSVYVTVDGQSVPLSDITGISPTTSSG